MDKAFSPADIETRIYAEWEARGRFAPSGRGPAFSIVIPPPNVTGTLHMGHAFQDTIMDALIRYRRMLGCNTLWQPGTDHAGIATQMVVERQLQAAGQSRTALGRDAFVARVWEWKKTSGGTIATQLRRLGASVDWRRDKFTMDPELSRSVAEAFVRLHQEGLIYRGKRLVNWDPVLKTALSDLEVVAEEEMAAGMVPRLDGRPFWLVDPLDGTKEFIKRLDEFTVNIALIENGRPILGVVLAPAKDALWRGAAGLGADMSEKDGPFINIRTRTPPAAGLTAFASRSTAIYADLDIWFRNSNLRIAERKQAGSSLKFCLIAEGSADIYPRFGPTNEWDTAAGQGVLEAAGGEVVTTDGAPLAYGKKDFRNPHFIARSKEAR